MTGHFDFRKTRWILFSGFFCLLFAGCGAELDQSAEGEADALSRDQSDSRVGSSPINSRFVLYRYRADL